MKRILPFVLLASLAGCGSSQLANDRYPTGSSTLATSADARRVYAVNVDEGTITSMDSESKVTSTLAVGSEPTRIARAGDRLLVTLRGQAGIAVVTDSEDGLALERVVGTGTEPYGIVASEDGRRVYVALSTQGEVQELDGESLAVLRSWPISGEPRWLALHPSGKSLYVASAFGGMLHHVDVTQDGVVTSIAPPHTTGNTGNDLSARITGDISISPNGGQLAIPSLYVDNLTEVGSSDEPSPDGGVVSDGYGSVGLGVSRLNPVVGLLPLGSDGSPAGSIDPMLFSGVATLSTFAPSEAVRSYPSSATYAPDGHTVWLTLEASTAVAVVPTVARHLPPSQEDFADTGFGATVDAATAGFSVGFPVMIGTDAGPRGVTFTSDDSPWVHAFLDRSVAPIDRSEADAILAQGFDGDDFVDTNLTGGRAKEATPIEVSRMSAEVELGRRLFFSATDDRMAGAGSGVSCSTCHADGRNDGLTWHTHAGEQGFRNTPSLVGGTSQNFPVTWAEGVESVSAEAEITSQTRMGGIGIASRDLENIQAFVDQQRLPYAPAGDAAAIARGADVFTAVGCDTCHSGAQFVDHLPHRVVDLAVDTPTLRGIGATAPYLHDGSAGSLEAVLLVSDAGLMGDTSSLSAAQKADLLAFLRSL